MLWNIITMMVMVANAFVCAYLLALSLVCFGEGLLMVLQFHSHKWASQGPMGGACGDQSNKDQSCIMVSWNITCVEYMIS